MTIKTNSLSQSVHGLGNAKHKRLHTIVNTNHFYLGEVSVDFGISQIQRVSLKVGQNPRKHWILVEIAESSTWHRKYIKNVSMTTTAFFFSVYFRVAFLLLALRERYMYWMESTTSGRLKPNCSHQRFLWKDGIVYGFLIAQAQNPSFIRCY